MNKITRTQSSLTLNVFHLPVLLLLILVVAASGGLAAKKLLPNGNGLSAVLSDEDENESEDSEDSEDGEDSDEDENDSEDSRDSKDSDDDKDGKDEDEDIEDVDDMDDKDVDEDESEIEDEEDKTVVVSTVVNADGTTTKTVKKIEDDGEFELRQFIYNASGKVVDQVELNDDGTVKEDDDMDEDENEIEDENENEFEYEIKIKEANENSEGLAATNRIKIKFTRSLNNNEELAGKVEQIEMALEESDGSFEYKAVAEKSEKLLGIFKISIPVQMTVDPETGEISSIDQSLISKILDILSF